MISETKYVGFLPFSSFSLSVALDASRQGLSAHSNTQSLSFVHVFSNEFYFLCYQVVFESYCAKSEGNHGDQLVI